MSLAILSLGNDNIDVVRKIVSSKIFDNHYIITDINGKNSFNDTSSNISYILIDIDNPVEHIEGYLENSIKKKLSEDKFVDLEIGINISSGTGKLHAALLSAIIKLGYSFKLIEIDKDGDVISL